jgi:hypothetical protein
MRRTIILLVLCTLACAAMPSAGVAGVPSPANSTLPACMALCPLGDMPFVVVVRDLASNPIFNSTVVLDYSQCPGAYICAGIPTDPYVVNMPARTLRAVTDASGTISFHARIGGTGAAGSVHVLADGVFLKSYALASPDQNGDGVVISIGTDDPIFAAKLGTLDPTADFDCDGHVDAADQIVFFAHHSHSCVGYVDPTLRSTWGRLKTHYR